MVSSSWHPIYRTELQQQQEDEEDDDDEDDVEVKKNDENYIKKMH